MRFNAFRFARARNAHLSSWARNYNQQFPFFNSSGAAGPGSQYWRGAAYTASCGLKTSSLLQSTAEFAKFGFSEQVNRAGGTLAPHGFGDISGEATAVSDVEDEAIIDCAIIDLMINDRSKHLSCIGCFPTTVYFQLGVGMGRLNWYYDPCCEKSSSSVGSW